MIIIIIFLIKTLHLLHSKVTYRTPLLKIIIIFTKTELKD